MGGGKGSKTEYEVAEYYLSVDFGISHGPLDSINEIWIKEKRAWAGRIRDNKTIPINEKELFGGKKKEGGVYGIVDAYLGTSDQKMSAASASRYGLESDDCPGYRGIAHIMFRGPEGSSEEASLNNTPSNPYLGVFGTLFGSTVLSQLFGAAASKDAPENQKGFLWVMNNPYMPAAWASVTRIPRGWREDIAAVPRAEDGTFTQTVALDSRVNSGTYLNGLRIDGFTPGSTITAQLYGDKAWSAWSGATKWLTEFYIMWDNGSIVHYNLSPGGSYYAPFDNVFNSEAEAVAAAVPINITALSNGGRVLVDSGFTTSDNTGVMSVSFTGGFDIAKADANPAHMIRECLTNEMWGLGHSTADIGASFETAAETLFAEGFGLTMMWTQQSSVEKVVQEICDHIQAMVYIDPDTGLWEMTLIRGDYDVADLVVLDQTNCTATSRQRKAMSETTNEIVVTYTDPTSHEEASVVFQDIANMGMQGGTRSESRNYYGIRSSALAQKVGSRDLRAASYPLFSCSLTVDTTVGRLKPGQVVVFNWPDDDLYGMPLRVYKVDYGKPGSSSMQVTVTEDVFGLGLVSYDALDGSADDSTPTPPVPVGYLSVITPPLPLLLRSGVSLSDVEDADYPGAIMAVFGNTPGEPVTSLRLIAEVTKPNNEVVEEIVSEVPDTPLQLSQIAFAAEASSSVSGDDLRTMLGIYVTPQTGDFIQLGLTDEDSEIVMLYAYDSGTDVYTVARGIFDTVPKAWPLGTPVWYLGTSLFQLEPSENTVGVDDFYRVITVNGVGALPTAEATTHNFVPTQRAYAPHRPANVKFNGVAFPVGVIDAESTGTVSVSWVHRDRLAEDVVAPRWTDANVTPETGQETNILLLDPGTGAEVNRITGLTGTTATITAGDFLGRGRLRAKVVAVRDGFESVQGHSVEIKMASGYGYGYGFNYGGA